MKYLTIGLSLINGLWMLVDGVYVTANGKYIGPEKPGPWASLVSLTGVDVFRLGPVFILFGVAWLVFVWALFSDATWARSFGVVLSIATLWYFPFGTLISVVVLVAFIFFIKS
jgi:hypothetical protein